MATLAALREYVRDGLDDSDVLDDTIDRWINGAVRKVSSLVLLKVLESRVTKTTDPSTQFMDLPESFGHNLFMVGYSGGKIVIVPNMPSMLDRYPSLGIILETGPPEHCCIHGSQLALSATPSSATDITLFFHTWPIPMTAENHTPDLYIPHDDMQEDLIASYVWSRMHRTIEDSLEGPQSNTSYHREAFIAAMRDFDREMSRSGLKSARPKPPGGTGWI